MARRTQFWIALLLGSFLFVLNNTAVWSAWLNTPEGYEPLFLVRSHDMAEYVTYLVTAQQPSLLAPDLHAPWTLPGGLFHPWLLIAGRLGHGLHLTPAFTFQAAYYLFCIAGVWVLLNAMAFFLPTVRQRWWAFLGIAASVPLTLLPIVAKPLLPIPAGFYALGMIHFAYNSADGLFRGGMSNSFTVAWGTIAMLSALTFTGKRIVTGETRYRYLSAGTMFFSALLHPFEYFVMAPASTIALLWAAKKSGKWRDGIIDSAWNLSATAIGLLPAIYLAFRYKWISDLSTVCTERMYPTWLFAIFGLPCILTVYCLLLRYRPATPSDQVLAIWFVTTGVLACLPYCPYPPHMLNGFVYVTAMLLVRLLFEHHQARTLYQTRPRLVFGLASGVVAVSLTALACLHLQLWKDGRSKEPELLFSALATTEERAVSDWLRGRATREDLVLAPPDMAPWLTQVPMHAFASHVLTGFNYTQQLEQANAFYQGESPEAAHELLQAYGIHWVVVPSDSAASRYFSGQPAAKIGNLRLYEAPGARMNPYPGLAQLVPEAANTRSLSRLVLDATSGISRLLESFHPKPRT
jgi:hypothetical protein